MKLGMHAGTAGLILLSFSAGCGSQPTGTDERLDPTEARTDMGTLVDISDVLEVSQKMVDSLRRSQNVDGIIRERKPVLIAIEAGQIKNLTSMTNFSKRIFVNQMMAILNQRAGEDFQFLDREAVGAERARQLGGEVKTSGLDGTSAGADLVFSGRILEKLDQKPAQGGAVEETRSVQFFFSLVRVKDAVTLWSDSFYRVKQQVIGTVYS